LDIQNERDDSYIRQKWDEDIREKSLNEVDKKKKKGKERRILKTKKKNLRMMMVLEQADVGSSV
jgi:hypothetical protein